MRRRARWPLSPNANALLSDRAQVRSDGRHGGGEPRLSSPRSNGSAASLPAIFRSSSWARAARARSWPRAASIALSSRSRAPFIAVNCAALSETLILSDLFGHARGAFTGADRSRQGVFESANGGTVFLDEIGDLPLSAQGLLLRVLQEGEVRPLGETLPRKVNVRVLAATHRDLDAMVGRENLPPGPLLPSQGRKRVAAGLARSGRGRAAPGRAFRFARALRRGARACCSAISGRATSASFRTC